ncbi:MAG: glycoside hydrolase family 16 protein [Pseudomonadota bacterium]
MPRTVKQGQGLKAGRSRMGDAEAGGLHPLTQAWVDAMGTTPSPERLAAYDWFVRMNADLIARCDLFYVTGHRTAEEARVNLADPGRFRLTKAGTGEIAPQGGVRSNPATGGFWRTGFIPERDATKATLNDCGVYAFICSNEYTPLTGTAPEAASEWAMVKGIETDQLTGLPTTVAGRISRAATFRSPNAATSGITTAVGFTGVTRTAAAQTYLHRNGVQCGAAGGPSVRLGDLELLVGTFETFAGTPETAIGSPRRIGAFLYGDAFTGAEQKRLTDGLGTLLQALGSYDPAEAANPPYQPIPPDPYAPGAEYVFTEAFAGAPLDEGLLGAMTFEDNFADTSGITLDGGAGPWRSPVRAKVGAAEYGIPGEASDPFSAAQGALDLKIHQVAGVWRAAHMQTMGSDGQGFSQAYGYFEARLKVPVGQIGCWAAFWLYTDVLYKDATKTRGEIDVLEYYPGNNRKGHHKAVHLRPAPDYQTGQISQPWHTASYQSLDVLADGDWHTHGVLITPDWLIFYLDRVELSRFPMRDEFRQPMFLLLSNQLLPQEAAQAVSPVHAYVDHVRVWALAGT